METHDSVIRQRQDLQFLEGTEVECSGRVKEFRLHRRRKDLESVCLVSVFVTPVPIGETIFLDHLWVLRKQFTNIGYSPIQNDRVYFLGKVYSYRRLGGRSVDRGLFGLKDFGVLPLEIQS